MARDYWIKRALADEAVSNRLAAKASAEMQKLYREQYRKIVASLEGLMAQVAEGETPTRTQLWEYSKWRRLEKQLAALAGTAEANVQTVANCLDEVFREVIGVAVEGVASTAWSVAADPKIVLNTAWSGEHYSARIWRNTAAIAERIQSDVADMVVQGRGISDVRRRVMADFSVAYNDADRLVRTEAAYVRNQAAIERYKRSGQRKVRWITGPQDGRECAICLERADKVYLLGSEPLIPAHPRCRCCYAPVVELEGENVEVTGAEDLRGKGKSDTMILSDDEILRSLGAKVRNYDITDAEGRVYRYVEGTKIQNREVFAGYGVKTPLHEGVPEGLTREYGGNVAKWQHVKGFGTIDRDGEEVHAEIHWFQEESVGQVKHKIKRWTE